MLLVSLFIGAGIAIGAIAGLGLIAFGFSKLIEKIASFILKNKAGPDQAPDEKLDNVITIKIQSNPSPLSNLNASQAKTVVSENENKKSDAYTYYDINKLDIDSLDTADFNKLYKEVTQSEEATRSLQNILPEEDLEGFQLPVDGHTQGMSISDYSDHLKEVKQYLNDKVDERMEDEEVMRDIMEETSSPLMDNNDISNEDSDAKKEIFQENDKSTESDENDDYERPSFGN